MAFERQDVQFPSGDASCAAWLYLPDGVDKPPVVVMGHGLGAVREMGLAPYAERFAEAGMASLVFTYRHFGDSEGDPRQLLSVARQLADWEAAIAYARALPQLDGTRLALWGTSFGGGHAIEIAARHPELRAVVCQCPFTDGIASALALGPRSTLRATPRVVRDMLAAARGTAPVLVPVAGPPGSAGLMTAPDALAGMHALTSDARPWVNGAAARVALDIVRYRPGRAARRVTVPMLVCVSKTDSVAPARATLRHLRSAPHAEVVVDPAGHFAFYHGAPRERLATRQAEFLARHLVSAPAPARIS